MCVYQVTCLLWVVIKILCGYCFISLQNVNVYDIIHLLMLEK